LSRHRPTTTTPARRAVRFSPVAVVVDDERGRGIRTATRLRDAEVVSAAESERRVEELLRALSVAEERERAKESSESSSSDLFELESFPPAFEDAELPPRPRASPADAGLERPQSRVYN
jgi:3-methyladenine DNA glycosylase/8-oxoguanine DNA glycosylase